MADEIFFEENTRKEGRDIKKCSAGSDTTVTVRACLLTQWISVGRHTVTVIQTDYHFISEEGHTSPTLVGVIAADTVTGALWAMMLPGKGAS